MKKNTTDITCLGVTGPIYKDPYNIDETRNTKYNNKYIILFIFIYLYIYLIDFVPFMPINEQIAKPGPILKIRLTTRY